MPVMELRPCPKCGCETWHELKMGGEYVCVRCKKREERSKNPPPYNPPVPTQTS